MDPLTPARLQCIRDIQTIFHNKLTQYTGTNTTVQQFFPTLAHFRTYAQHNNHSWALGQLLAGQHPLAQHLYDTHRRPSPTCPICQNQPETLTHFIYECPVFETHRTQHLPLEALRAEYTPPIPSQLTASHERLKALDAYLIATRRFFVAAWLPHHSRSYAHGMLQTHPPQADNPQPSNEEELSVTQ